MCSLTQRSAVISRSSDCTHNDFVFCLSPSEGTWNTTIRFHLNSIAGINGLTLFFALNSITSDYINFKFEFLFRITPNKMHSLAGSAHSAPARLFNSAFKQPTERRTRCNSSFFCSASCSICAPHMTMPPPLPIADCQMRSKSGEHIFAALFLLFPARGPPLRLVCGRKTIVNDKDRS